MKRDTTALSALIFSGAIMVGIFLVTQTIFAVTGPINSSVTVGNAAPTVSGLILNGGSSITLTANATTAVNVFATIADNNGCTDLTGGTTTVLLYRNGIGSSTCLSTANNQNCYQAFLFTASSTCTGTSTSISATTTFGVYYFAQATDASSSFLNQGWRATVIFKDPSNATGTSDSATTSLLSLTSLNITTSSISYGTLAASSTTGAVNQTTTLTNAGNTSSTLNLSGTALLSAGGTIPTSSQAYATSSFTYPGTSNPLSGSPVSVSGFTFTAPTSLTNVSGTLFWGLSVPAGTPTGTFTGTSTFTAVYTP